MQDSTHAEEADGGLQGPQEGGQGQQEGGPGGSSGPKPQRRKGRKGVQRLYRCAPDDPEAVADMISELQDDEELVERLMQQLQGLTFKTQKLYGIWDGTPDGGRRTFVERWRQRHAERCAMVAGLGAAAPGDRMELRTAYILKWRKVLFSCPGCWLLPGLCVCGRMQRFTPRTKVVVHVHHGEWGSASNSGCILPTALEGAEILLYSHPDHDRRMHELLSDPTRTTALLWPGADSLLPEQLSALAEERTQGRITVIALDATWSNARRMHGWFPKGTLTVRLPPESTLKEHKLSLLRPVRAYGGDLTSGRVSTVEAVASLLHELEGDDAILAGLQDNLRIKVDACRLQKNAETVYGTHEPLERAAPRDAQRGPGRRGARREAASGAHPAAAEEHSGLSAPPAPRVLASSPLPTAPEADAAGADES